MLWYLTTLDHNQTTTTQERETTIEMAPSLTTALPSIFGKKDKIPYTSHPFQSLSPSEIEAAAAVVKAEYPSDADLHYKAITLLEPEKEVVKIWLAADQKPSLDRRAFVLYYLRNTVRTLTMA